MASKQAKAKAAAASRRARELRQKRAKATLPKKLEKQYRRRLLRRVRMASEMLQDRLEPALDAAAAGIATRAAEREAAVAAARKGTSPQKLITGILPAPVNPEGERVARILAEIVRTTAAAFALANPVNPADVLQFAATVDTVTSAGIKRTVETVAGIKTPTMPALVSLHERFAANNVRLIESLGQRLFDETAAAVADGVSRGRATKEIAERIRKRTGVARSRAKLIARNEVGNLNAQITQQRQTSLGISEYTWSTSLDDDVRPEHAEREGVTFSWDNPPSDGHPGEPINCRCTPIPVIPKS